MIRPFSMGTMAGLTLVLCAGCASIGPSSVRVERTSYNEAVVGTEEQELLLNIVRTRYLRGLAFLQVSSISSNIGFAASIGGVLNRNNNILGSFAEGGIAYSDSPTIIYQPVSGELFVRQLLTPLSLDALGLLIDGGFDPSDVFRVFVASMNGVPNAVSASTGTPDAVTEFEEFESVIQNFTTLSRSGHVVGGVGSKVRNELLLEILPAGRASEAGRELIGSLRLDPAIRTYRMLLSESPGGRDIIAMKTRSVSAAIQYLSKGVGVPLDRRSEVHGIGEDEDPKTSWSKLLDGVFDVKVSKTEPNDASIRVPYGGNWYYIAEHDIPSKKNFAMLATVLRLQAGGGVVEAPLLTLPVAR